MYHFESNINLNQLRGIQIFNVKLVQKWLKNKYVSKLVIKVLND